MAFVRLSVPLFVGDCFLWFMRTELMVFIFNYFDGVSLDYLVVGF